MGCASDLWQPDPLNLEEDYDNVRQNLPIEAIRRVGDPLISQNAYRPRLLSEPNNSVIIETYETETVYQTPKSKQLL